MIAAGMKEWRISPSVTVDIVCALSIYITIIKYHGTCSFYVETFVYYACSKCGFMFWVERNKHWTKTYIPTLWESIGYFIENY